MNKVWRILGLTAVIVLVFGAIMASTTIKPSAADQVWDMRTTLGSPDASNYFIVYSDLACPYCIAFEEALVENEDELNEYLEENDILLEVRLSDFLYEYGETQPEHSRLGAIASYCARDEGKFWDYYNSAIKHVWNDFYKDNGKSGGQLMAQRDQDYWLDIAKEVGLGDDFKSCFENKEPLAEIEEAAEKSAKQAGGLPYFKFNKYTQNGFDMKSDWDRAKTMFEVGLSSK